MASINGALLSICYLPAVRGRQSAKLRDHIAPHPPQTILLPWSPIPPTSDSPPHLAQSSHRRLSSMAAAFTVARLDTNVSGCTHVSSACSAADRLHLRRNMGTPPQRADPPPSHSFLSGLGEKGGGFLVRLCLGRSFVLPARRTDGHVPLDGIAASLIDLPAFAKTSRCARPTREQRQNGQATSCCIWPQLIRRSSSCDPFPYHSSCSFRWPLRPYRHPSRQSRRTITCRGPACGMITASPERSAPPPFARGHTHSGPASVLGRLSLCLPSSTKLLLFLLILWLVHFVPSTYCASERPLSLHTIAACYALCTPSCSILSVIREKRLRGRYSTTKKQNRKSLTR